MRIGGGFSALIDKNAPLPWKNFSIVVRGFQIKKEAFGNRILNFGLTIENWIGFSDECDESVILWQRIWFLSGPFLETSGGWYIHTSNLSIEPDKFFSSPKTFAFHACHKCINRILCLWIGFKECLELSNPDVKGELKARRLITDLWRLVTPGQQCHVSANYYNGITEINMIDCIREYTVHRPVVEDMDPDQEEVCSKLFICQYALQCQLNLASYMN